VAEASHRSAIQRNGRRGAMSVVATAALLLPVACSSGSGTPNSTRATSSVQNQSATDSPITHQNSESVPSLPETSAAISDSPGPSDQSGDGELDFEYTTTDGWHYSGQLPFPKRTLSVSKDISSSPPGRAQINAQLSGQPYTDETFSDDNVGRPNGPPLVVHPGWIDYGGPAPQDVPDQFGPCHISTAGAPDIPPVKGLAYDCDMAKAGTDQPVSGEDGVESSIDQLIASLPNSPWVYDINFEDIGTSCSVFISATGKISRPSDYDNSVCGVLDLTLA
jgi:hypothetical protein